MRAIKFRGKTELTGEWVYGFFSMGSSVRFEHPKQDERIVPRYLIDDGLLHDVIPETVGQFTNLHDMDGMEIYEGDVLMIEGIKTNRYSKVWWNPDKFTFYIGHSPMDAYLRKDGNLCDFCIVGNIYDNPKLCPQTPTV